MSNQRKTLAELVQIATSGTYRVMVRLADTTKGPLKNGWTGSPMYRTGADLLGAVDSAATMASIGEATEIRLIPMDGEVLVWTVA